MRETWVQSLGWEYPLEKEMATHSSILAWRISWTEEPGRLQSTGSQRVRHDWATSLSLSLSCTDLSHMGPTLLPLKLPYRPPSSVFTQCSLLHWELTPSASSQKLPWLYAEGGSYVPFGLLVYTTLYKQMHTNCLYKKKERKGNIV